MTSKKKIPSRIFRGTKVFFRTFEVRIYRGSTVYKQCYRELGYEVREVEIGETYDKHKQKKKKDGISPLHRPTIPLLSRNTPLQAVYNPLVSLYLPLHFPIYPSLFPFLPCYNYKALVLLHTLWIGESED